MVWLFRVMKKCIKDFKLTSLNVICMSRVNLISTLYEQELLKVLPRFKVLRRNTWWWLKSPLHESKVWQKFHMYICNIGGVNTSPLPTFRWTCKICCCRPWGSEKDSGRSGGMDLIMAQRAHFTKANKLSHARLQSINIFQAKCASYLQWKTYSESFVMSAFWSSKCFSLIWNATTFMATIRCWAYISHNDATLFPHIGRLKSAI